MRKPQPLLADYFCSSCRAPFLSAYPLDEQGRCGLCRAGANGFDAAYTFGSYENELRKLVHLFKYERIQTLAASLGKLLAVALPREVQFDVIVPVPMHWIRRWQRGFNQAELLARELSRRTGLPVSNAARRKLQRTAQAGLTNAKRRDNVSGVFRARRSARLEGKRVLLIDDVLTTGATAGACARALKRAGAVHVSLLAVARTDRRLTAVSKEVSTEFPESTVSGSFTHAESGSFA